MTFHHFTGKGLTRSEKIEKRVADLILHSRLGNEKRESSLQWELKHSSGMIQLTKILAQKRGVDEELAIIAAALHDIHVIVNGNYDEHAKKGSEIARGMLVDSNEFSKDEVEKICEAIKEHSNKHIYSDNKLAELIKDADCLDCSLYTYDGYEEKPTDKRIHYYKRIAGIRKELGLPESTEITRKLELAGR